MAKPTVAVFDFTGCEGCELNQLNFENQLLDMLEHVDFVWQEDVFRCGMPSGMSRMDDT